jgi:chemotaxis protein histidine kinase CheA
MNSRLEQFVRDHREEFDGEEPDNKVWEKILQDVDPGKKKPAPKVVRLDWRRWSAAAAVLVVVAGAAWFFGAHSTGKGDSSVAGTTPVVKPAQTTNDSQTARNPAPAFKDSVQVAKNPTIETIRPKEEKMTKEEASGMDEEMYHYARLVEIKHNQLKAIEKDEPLLYRQFASDVNKLDSVYHSLQSELPKNPNREQLLEAMLQNLQLQMQLLNHQLDIIKQINHSKKTEYEKAFKTT